MAKIKVAIFQFSHVNMLRLRCCLRVVPNAFPLDDYDCVCLCRFVFETDRAFRTSLKQKGGARIRDGDGAALANSSRQYCFHIYL